MPDGTPRDLRERVYGKHRGIVLRSDDPERRGRLTAMVPEVLAEVPTGWADPCVPYAGLNAGFLSLPLPGAGVWIEFEGGDVSRPIWTGCYWRTAEAPMPPPAGAGGEQAQKIWRSDLGFTVMLDDGAQRMTVTDPTGQNKVEVDVATGTVTIKGLAKVVHDGKLVHIGSAAARHPAAFGDDLLTYLSQLVTIFNAHVHPGELALGVLPVTPAPPVGPMPPPTPALISTKVFVE